MIKNGYVCIFCLLNINSAKSENPPLHTYIREYCIILNKLTDAISIGAPVKAAMLLWKHYYGCCGDAIVDK